MRRGLLLLTLALLILPAPAQAAAGDPIFGRAQCSPAFRCPATFTSESLRSILNQVISIANSCVSSRFAMRSAGGYFDPARGLDFNQCLSTKDIPRAPKGLTMVPECCIQHSPSNPTVCQVVCTKYGMR